MGNKKIIKIYAGRNHSMAIGQNNEVYVWGDGEFGQLARSLTKSDTPIQVDDLIKYEIKSG